MNRQRLVLLIAVVSLFLVAGFVTAGAFRDPDRQELFTRARRALADGRPAAALTDLAQIEGDGSKSTVALEARLFEVAALERLDRCDEAIAKAEALHAALPEDHPGRGRARFALASALDAKGDLDRSAQVWAEEAEALSGDTTRARIAAHYVSLAEEFLKPKPSEDLLADPRPANPRWSAELYGRAIQVLSDGRPIAVLTLPRAEALLLYGDAITARNELAQLLKKELPDATERQARLLHAEASAMAGDPRGARSDLERLLGDEKFTESDARAKAQALLGEVLVRAEPGPEGVALSVAAFEAFLNEHPQHERAAEIAVRRAEVRSDAGLHAEAIPAWRALTSVHGVTEEQKARAALEIAESHRRLQDYAAARTAFAQFLERYGDDARAPRVQALLPRLWLEEAAFASEEEREADCIAALEAYLKEAPLASDAPEAALRIAALHREAKRLDRARETYGSIRERYRTHAPEAAGRAGLQLGVLLEEDDKDLAQAIAAYKGVIKDFGHTGAARLARLRVATLEAVSLSLKVDRLFIPGEGAKVKLAARNIEETVLRLYRLDARDWFEAKGSLDGLEQVEVALVKADRTHTYEVPNYTPHVQHEMEVAIELEEGQPLPAGSYLLAAEAGERRAEVLLHVSGVRLVVKSAPKEVFCWALDAKSGEPLPDTTILCRGADLTETLTTDAEGIARLKLDEPKRGIEVLAVRGDGVAPGRLVSEGGPTRQGLSPRAAVTLDRPIYRPGDTLRFSVLLRDVVDGAHAAPKEGSKVVVDLRDGRGRFLMGRELATDPFGRIAGALPIPLESLPGRFTLAVQMGEERFNEPVIVQHFEKPAAEVRVRTERSVVAPGDLIDVALEAALYHGGALPDAAFTWMVFSAPLEIDRDRFLSYAWYLEAIGAKEDAQNAPSGDLIAEGRGVLDGEGKGTFSFASSEQSANRRYLIMAYVFDAAGGNFQGVTTAYSGPVDRFAVVLSERRVQRAGDQASVKVITRTLSDRPAPTQGRLVALVRRQEPGKAPTLDPVAEATIDTGLEGETTAKLTLPESGDYVLRFEGLDGRRRPVVGTTDFAVSGERADLDHEARLQFEKAAYRAGTTARMHLQLPKAGRPVLLTYEAEGIIGHRILRPGQRAEVHELAVQDAWAPNVFVSVAAPYGEELYTAHDEILVLRYLDVAVRPSVTEGRPGDEVAIAVEAMDQAGRPVQASLALRVVDQALSGLGGREVADPRHVFNQQRRDWRVRTRGTHGWSFAAEASMIDPDVLALLGDRDTQLGSQFGRLGQLQEELEMAEVQERAKLEAQVRLLRSESKAELDASLAYKDRNGEVRRQVELERMRLSSEMGARRESWNEEPVGLPAMKKWGEIASRGAIQLGDTPGQGGAFGAPPALSPAPNDAMRPGAVAGGGGGGFGGRRAAGRKAGESAEDSRANWRRDADGIEAEEEVTESLSFAFEAPGNQTISLGLGGLADKKALEHLDQEFAKRVADHGVLSVLDSVTSGLPASAATGNGGPGLPGGAAAAPSAGVFYSYGGGNGDIRGRTSNLFTLPPRVGLYSPFDLRDEWTAGEAGRLRMSFVDVAAFFPSLLTNEEGQATVKFRLPDNLTRWRLVASGADLQTRAGRGEASVAARRPVVARIDRPPFLTSGDRTTVGLIATSQEDTARYTAALAGGEAGPLRTAPLTEPTFDLGRGRGVLRTSELSSEGAGTGLLKASLVAEGQEGDALDEILPVLPFGQPWMEAVSRTLTDRAEMEVVVPEGLVHGTLEGAVLVTSGESGRLLSGISWLASCRQGGLVPTLGTFVPAALVAGARREAGLPELGDPAALRDAVARGLARLVAFQRGDGSFGFWPEEGASRPELTATVLDAVARLRAYGISDANELHRATLNAARRAIGDRGTGLEAQVMLLLAMARSGDQDASQVARLFRDRGSLSRLGLARFVVAAALMERAEFAASAFEDLKARALEDTNERRITLRPGAWMHGRMEADAMVLEAFLRRSGSEATVAALTDRIRQDLDQRRGGVQGVVAAVSALSLRIAREAEILNKSELVLLLDGKEVAKGTIGEKGMPQAILAIDPKVLQAGRHRLTLQAAGSAALEARFVLRGLRAADEVAASPRGLEVTRRVLPYRAPDESAPVHRSGFNVVKPHARPEAPDEQTLTSIASGERVTVELKIKARQALSYVMIEEPLFAGLDPIMAGVRGPQTRTERRSDRLVFWFDALPEAQEMVIRYPAFARHVGQYRGRPAVAEPLQVPELASHSASGQLEILPPSARLDSGPTLALTPDERFGAAEEAWKDERFTEALDTYLELDKGFDLREDIRDHLLGRCVLAGLRADRPKEAIRAFEELRLRAPERATLSLNDRLRLGHAYLSSGDARTARSWFTEVALARFPVERQVVSTLDDLGRRDEALQHLRRALFRYPDEGEVALAAMELGDRYLALDREVEGRRPEGVAARRWPEAMDAWLSVMAQHPGTGLAANAGLRRVRLLQNLDLAAPLATECASWLGNHGKTSREADEVTFTLAKASFAERRFHEAGTAAKQVWEATWPLDAKEGARSAWRDEAGHLLGRLAHVQGQEAEAVAWYEKVKDEVPDARASWRYFTETRMSCEMITRAKPGEARDLEIQVKNCDEITARFYPVDLSVLFSAKKRFDRLADAVLSGVRPESVETLKAGLPPYREGSVSLPLGERKAGAWLVLLRGEGLSANTLLVVSDATLSVQREGGTIRAWLVDGEGRPVEDALVRIGVDGRIVATGRSDARGLFTCNDPGGERVTVVAEKGELVAIR